MKLLPGLLFMLLVGLTGKIKGKTIKGGDAIVVHYQGPYDQIAAAYAAISKWLNENNKKPLSSHLKFI